MTTKLSDQQYEELKERVAQGKEFLQDKWGSIDSEVRGWIRLWFDLSEQLFDQYRIRKLFPQSSMEQMKEKQEATLERAREQMITLGLVKKPIERRIKKNDTTKSEGTSLF